MKVAIAVDNRMGTGFNHRRLSRDRELLQDLLTFSDAGVLRVSPYSEKLLAGYGIPCQASPDYLNLADREDLCFAELDPLLPYEEKIDTLILYRWLRDYPYDQVLDLDLSHFSLTERKEFAGSSHEKLVREVYVHEQK